ncbi:glycosyltransferase family 1 protein [Microlunatus sp. GCM10028923]|uniref:rhamnosyltransferase WsaF family glycosyltransferase n=1 Tax=Microlunatus sp. GCM10028923 TaxID=3273400 RepID=UPI0036167A79
MTGRMIKAVGKIVGIVRRDGMSGAAARTARFAYHRLGAGAWEPLLLPEDVVDSQRLRLPVPFAAPVRGTRLTIGWVITPPALGSGGHTTMFRMVEALEAAGHRCVIFVYDRYSGDLDDHRAVIRQGWPAVQSEVRDAKHGIRGVDAGIATGWDSAHVLASRGVGPMRRLYFIQDYEPYFYPHSPEYALAEDSYRFGFRCIALGDMVATALRNEIGLEPDVAPFGCDTDVYRLLPDEPRTGVVCYARPGTARRGFWLGSLALTEFQRRHHDVPIHVYGDAPRTLPYQAIRHGRLTPVELNSLYNTCIAGLALSFTNISLVAEEMLAAGTVPVINDSPRARADLKNDHARWARPTPSAMAEALSMIVSAPADPVEVAASVRRGWAPAQSGVVRVVEEEVYGRQLVS